ALIGAGRAAERIGGRRHHHRAAVFHGFELTAQQQRLLAGLPGMRHAFRGGLVIAGQTVPTDVDTGRDDQAVVGKPSSVAERHCASLRVDRGPRRELDDDLVAGELVVTEFLRLEVAKPGDDAVAEWAGGERRVRLDPRHRNARIDPVYATGTACTAEA